MRVQEDKKLRENEMDERERALNTQNLLAYQNCKDLPKPMFLPGLDTAQVEAAAITNFARYNRKKPQDANPLNAKNKVFLTKETQLERGHYAHVAAGMGYGKARHASISGLQDAGLELLGRGAVGARNTAPEIDALASGGKAAGFSSI